MYAAESKKIEVAEKQRELLLKKTEDRKVKELYSKKVTILIGLVSNAYEVSGS